MKNPIYSFKGTKYERTYNKSEIQNQQWFLRQLEAAAEQGDWVTVQNKINNGLMWGGVVEIGG